METLNHLVLQKMNCLLQFLTQTKNAFETLADEIENTLLKAALNGLSDESHYYETELRSYCKQMGISLQNNEMKQQEVAEAVTDNDTPYQELSQICTNKANMLTQAYQDLMKEIAALVPLKQMIYYQMQALQYSFLKIDLLNKARFVS